MSTHTYNLDLNDGSGQDAASGASGLAPQSQMPPARTESRHAQQAHVLNLPVPVSSNKLQSDPAKTRSGLSLRLVLRLVFSRWRLIAVVAACIIVATALAIVYMPPHYASEAKLLVRLGRESVVIDPTARIGQAAVPMEGRDKEINSEIELLKSRKLIEMIVQSLGTDRILSLPRNQPTTTENVSAAIKRVEDKLEVEAIPDSDILSIKFEARDPELARDVVAKLIEVYLDERSDIYRDPGDLKFFQDQLSAARDEQSQIQQQLKDLRDTSGVSDTTQQRLTLLSRISELQSDIDTNRAERVAQANSLSVVSRQVGSATASRQRQAQIAEDALLASLIQSQEAQKTAATKSLDWVNEVDVKAQKLQQEQTLAAARVTQYAEGYEQARINRAMGEQRLSNISIAEPPVLPLQPKAPNKSLLALAGLFLAATMGLGSALVAEELDHTVRSAQDLHSLGFHQVVSIPIIADELDAPAQPHGFAKSDSNGHSAADIIDAIHTRGPSRSSPPKGTGANDADHGISAAQEPVVPLRGVSRAMSQEMLNSTLAQKALAADDGLSALATDQASADAPAQNASQMSMTIVGAAIRPAHPVAISPRLLASVQGVAERLMPSYDEEAAPRLIGVIGPRRGQGTSTIALHLAVSLVQRLEGSASDTRGLNRVLLLDADIESSKASALAGVPVVRRNVDGVSTRHAAQFPALNMTVRRRQHSLDVLSAGMLPENALMGTQMPKLLRAIGQQYRHIVIDLPSLADNQASARLAGLCSAVVLVCKANELRIETAHQAVNRLRDAHANIAVTVLNQRRYPIPDWLYQRS
jgi:uncharacterized protein involved in exopolysaccharide biosynthesis/Mrp family chromosome partitioning ATPase